MLKPHNFTHEEDSELVNLLHLAKTALSGGDTSWHKRAQWAADEFSKIHPDISRNGAYKRLDVIGHMYSNPMRGSADETLAHDLYLFAWNDADLYRQQRKPIELNLQRKWRKGIYDTEKAVRLWNYLANSAAEKYHKEGRYDGKWFDLFNVPTRLAAAREMEKHYASEIKIDAEGGMK